MNAIVGVVGLGLHFFRIGAIFFGILGILAMILSDNMVKKYDAEMTEQWVSYINTKYTPGYVNSNSFQEEMDSEFFIWCRSASYATSTTKHKCLPESEQNVHSFLRIKYPGVYEAHPNEFIRWRS